MVEGLFFIATLILAITQAVKLLFPDKVNGATTIFVAAGVGLLVALVDVQIGVQDLTIAEGILAGLSAAGIAAAASKAGGKA